MAPLRCGAVVSGSKKHPACGGVQPPAFPSFERRKRRVFCEPMTRPIHHNVATATVNDEPPEPCRGHQQTTFFNEIGRFVQLANPWRITAICAKPPGEPDEVPRFPNPAPRRRSPPDLLKFEWCFLTNQFSLVPRFRNEPNSKVIHGRLLKAEEPQPVALRPVATQCRRQAVMAGQAVDIDFGGLPFLGVYRRPPIQ